MNDIEADLLIANAKIKQLEEQLADYHHTSELVNGKMAENQRLRRINENLQEQLAAERAKYAELQRYNVDCTKQCGMLQMDKVNLQTLLTESQRRGRAAVKDIEKMMRICEKGACHFCANGDCTESPFCSPKWRGPQEAGKGEAK